MPVVRTATKNWPSNRASRDSRARSYISLLSIGPVYASQETQLAGIGLLRWRAFRPELSRLKPLPQAAPTCQCRPYTADSQSKRVLCRPKVQMSGFLPDRNVRFPLSIHLSGVARLDHVSHGPVSAEEPVGIRRGVPARSRRASRRVVAGFATFASVRSRCCPWIQFRAAESRLFSTTSPGGTPWSLGKAVTTNACSPRNLSTTLRHLRS